MFTTDWYTNNNNDYIYSYFCELYKSHTLGRSDGPLLTTVTRRIDKTPKANFGEQGWPVDGSAIDNEETRTLLCPTVTERIEWFAIGIQSCSGGNCAENLNKKKNIVYEYRP